jgi:hypothetical protein
MSGQWEALRRNIGVWQGCFDTLDRDLHLVKRTPSQLTLEPSPSGVPINLRLLFWPDDPPEGVNPYIGDPIKQIQQSFYQVDRQLAFFPTGSFSRGSLQVAPLSRVYAEFCFLNPDRRLRLVLFWNGSGGFDQAILIREARAHSSSVEEPVLVAEALLGSWRGDETVISSDPYGDQAVAKPCSTTIDADALQGLRCLPDGGGFRGPEQVSHREGFTIEALQLIAPDRLERLERMHDNTGAWVKSRQQRLQRVA